MLRTIGRIALGIALLVLAGCDDGGGYYDNGYPAGYYYGYCEKFGSCDECTPVLGCGWCSYPDGKGLCVSQPNACGAQEFTWTWEPKGCGLAPDAGAPADASTDVSSNDASDADGASTCHWPDSADTFSSSDAGASGCKPSTGGNLCSSSQFTLTCYGTSVPDAALGCTVVPIPTPPGVLFNCCPCAP
jgi:hypothetical protein